jgi:hypothetical protein
VKTRLVFIYPDTRPESPNTLFGEGFEVEEGGYVAKADGSYALSIPIKKTVVEKVEGQKDRTTVVDTGRTKTTIVRPAYLWVEIEEIPSAE